MKDVFLVYNTSCFYEIVILNYFMSVTNCDMLFCSLDGNAIKTTEGFSVNVDMTLENLDKEQIRSFVIPGGDISIIDNEDFREFLKDLKKRDTLIAGICVGVDVLENAEILCEVKSIH